MLESQQKQFFPPKTPDCTVSPGINSNNQDYVVVAHGNTHSVVSNGKLIVNNNNQKENNLENNNCVNNNNVTASFGGGVKVAHLEPRPFRPFKSSEEYLYAMKEDLAEWLNALYNSNITVDNFMEKLETGVILCRHANNVIKKARSNSDVNCNNNQSPLRGTIPIGKELSYRLDVNPGTFHARDNVSNFISWCRKLGIMECLLFETDDLVLRKNEKSFILCLLEIARQGSKIGMIAPMLVQLEQEIDREIAQDAQVDDEKKKPSSPNGNDTHSITTQTQVTMGSSATTTTTSAEESKENRKEINSMKNLHEMVVDILNHCSCPSKFPMVKVADGKYRIGDTKVLIFVRILRNHVMVRVGGGWDTLGHYLDRHDPCRCRAGHRFSTSAKLTFTEGGDPSSGPQMVVTYNRPEEPVPNTNPSQINSNLSHPNGLFNGRSNGTVTPTLAPLTSNHYLKRRNSGSVNGNEFIVDKSNLPMVNGIKCNSNHRSKRSDQPSNVNLNNINGNLNESPCRLPSSISTSSTLSTTSSASYASSTSSSSSAGYPEVIQLLDRQESRTSHYSDDSTDTSSITMESPSPTQQLDSQLDDYVQNQQKQPESHAKEEPSGLINTNNNNSNNPHKSISVTANPVKTVRSSYHDSSSSEFSESEINHTPAISLSVGGRRRCSPRKIMKTADLLGTEKPSWASDDFNLDCDSTKEVVNGSTGNQVKSSDFARTEGQSQGSSGFQRNSRFRRSEQQRSTRIAPGNGATGNGLKTGEDKSKSRSSEDISKAGEIGGLAGGKMSWKNPVHERARAASHSVSASPNRPRRNTSEVKESQPMSCFERGRNYYASLPSRSRSSSQSSRTPITDASIFKTPMRVNGNPSSPFVRGSPGRYSLNTPRPSLPESTSLGSCRADRFGYNSSVNGRLSRQNSENGETTRTWTFKSRARPGIDPDLYKPCESSRSSSRYYGHQRSVPGQRSRSSDSSPSRVSLNTLIKVNAHTGKPVKLLDQFNAVSRLPLGDKNNNSQPQAEVIKDTLDGNFYTEESDFLEKMGHLVNQYQSYVERASPCKIVNNNNNCSDCINYEADCDEGKSIQNGSVIICPHLKCNSSKIPMPIRSTPRKEY